MDTDYFLFSYGSSTTVSLTCLLKGVTCVIPHYAEYGHQTKNVCLNKKKNTPALIRDDIAVTCPQYLQSFHFAASEWMNGLNGSPFSLSLSDHLLAVVQMREAQEHIHPIAPCALSHLPGSIARCSGTQRTVKSPLRPILMKEGQNTMAPHERRMTIRKVEMRSSAQPPVDKP